MKVLILGSQKHEKANAYSERRRADGDEVIFSPKGEIDTEVDEVVIPAETEDLEQVRTAYLKAEKTVTILGADAPSEKKEDDELEEQYPEDPCEVGPEPEGVSQQCC